MYPEWLKSIEDFKPSDEISAITCREGHCGIIFKKKDECFHFEHLGHFETELKNQILGEKGACQKNGYKFVWVQQTALKKERQRQIPRMCNLIHQFNKNGFPFGTTEVDSSFLPIDNFINAKKDNVAFTCSSFVLFIYEAAYINLIDKDSWEMRISDIKFQKKTLAGMIQDFKNRIMPKVKIKHIENQEKSIGNYRYKPEEVAVSGTGTRVPSSFEYCTENSKHLYRAFKGEELFNN